MTGTTAVSRRLSGAALLGAFALGAVPVMTSPSTLVQAKVDDGDGGGNSGGGGVPCVRPPGRNCF